MTDINKNSALSKKLLSRYHQCNAQEQILLKILAVAYQSINQTLLNRIAINLTAIKVFKISETKLALEPVMRKRLQSRGLLLATNKGLALPDSLYNSLIALCIEEDDLAAIYRQINTEIPVFSVSSWHYQTAIQRERQIRQSFFLAEFDELPPLLQPDKELYGFDENQTLIKLCFNPFDLQMMAKLPQFIIHLAFAALMQENRWTMVSNAPAAIALAALVDRAVCNDESKLLLVENDLYCGNLVRAEQLLNEVKPCCQALALSGWLAFMQGQFDKAIEFYERCIVAKNKVKRRKRQHIGGVVGVFYVMALLKQGYDGQPNRLKAAIAELENIVKVRTTDEHELALFESLYSLAHHFSGKAWSYTDYNFYYYNYDSHYKFQLSVLVQSLCLVWKNSELPKGYSDKLKDYFDYAVVTGNQWFAIAAANVLKHDTLCDKAVSSYLCQADTVQTNLYDLIRPKEHWLEALDQLISLEEENVGQPQTDDPNDNNMRLAWWVSGEDYHKVEAREQKRGKKSWTKGRVVALSRLFKESHLYEYLTVADEQIISQIQKSIEQNYYSYSGKEIFTLQGYSALKACVGHPNVFMADDISQPIDIIEDTPQLLITKNSNGFKIFMPELPDLDDGDEMVHLYNLCSDTANRYRLIHFNQHHQRIAQIVSPKGLVVPSKAKDKVLRSLKAVAPMLNIQSDIAGIGEAQTGIEQIAPDHQLYLNLQPQGSGLQIECHVQPLGEQGPSLLPGKGNAMVFAQVDNTRLSTQRNLKQERQAFEQLVQCCPMFAYMSEQLLMLDDMEEALITLESLEQIHASSTLPDIVLQWPKGKAVKLIESVGNDQMNVSLKQQKDWFSLEGELRIGDDEVIELKQLLKLVEGSAGRFIPLGDNQFLALTEQLKRQLNDIASTTVAGKFHSLAIPIIDEAVQGMKVRTNKAWKEQVGRLQASFALTPQLPATLQASLRDYQKDGYYWATRLAHWGGGACLADDMGLGKTLQALAVILARAADGPTLVLAPTSVCFNWQDEAHRFTPTLSVKMLGGTSMKERRLALASPKAFDVIICSYGLLQSEGERLAQINWQTMVADEAQAIKNPQAKRTQLAMKLTANFSMITTGTPIENNLSELWSLFNFINPGLLGSKKQFDERFANPIENSKKGDVIGASASQALRKLISPFILRRLKTDVLTELPSRTEINLHVQLSEQETAFYEALRQNAVEKMLESSDKPGQNRIKMLAEIMRLRRACCHPSLVVEDSPIAGSKLKVFDGLIDELKQGGHKALVFSQFVGHLSILREHLEKKGVSFQYLDGSTSVPKRKKAVNDFQAGEGDLFLISLKAGGAGLNLTAADYVIHMDPWWNPAVEDQASDRAHRMGQTRPVTIYRLISQHTIEDKIVALHQQKRDLANSLLEGSDSSGNMTFDDMMNLLKAQ